MQIKNRGSPAICRRDRRSLSKFYNNLKNRRTKGEVLASYMTARPSRCKFYNNLKNMRPKGEL